MLRYAAALILLVAGAPALAQPAAPGPGAATEVDAAAEAFNHCIGINAERVDAETTAEVAAAAVLATCAPHRRRLENVLEMMIATLPLERRGPAIERLRTSLNAAEAQIAEGIRQRRGETPRPAGPGS